MSTSELLERALMRILFTACFGIFAGAVVLGASSSAFLIPPQDTLIALSAGGGCLGLGLPLFTAAGKHVPAARTSLLLMSEIVLAPFWAWLVMSETPTIRTLAGGGIILLALVLVSRPAKSTVRPPPPRGGGLAANGVVGRTRRALVAAGTRTTRGGTRRAATRARPAMLPFVAFLLPIAIATTTDSSSSWYSPLLTRLGLPMMPTLTPAIVRPPAHLATLAVGAPMQTSRQCSVAGHAIAFQLERVSARPNCFHLKGLLSRAECDAIASAADEGWVQQATTVGGGALTAAYRTSCDLAWLPVEGAGTGAAIASCCDELLLTAEARASGRFENLQVLRYAPSGEYKPHFDASERSHRILTVLIYLNGVGGTWFPFARAEPTEHNPPRLAALATAPWLEPTRDGLTVAPAAGDAVAFYNYYCPSQAHDIGGAGGVALDRLALHAGLPAPSERRVAALWFRAG